MNTDLTEIPTYNTRVPSNKKPLDVHKFAPLQKEKAKSKLAQNLINYRLRNGWTQKALARRANLNVTTIHLIEGAKVYPHAHTIYQLSRAFKIDSQQLLGNVEVAHA